MCITFTFSVYIRLTKYSAVSVVELLTIYILLLIGIAYRDCMVFTLKFVFLSTSLCTRNVFELVLFPDYYYQGPYHDTEA